MKNKETHSKKDHSTNGGTKDDPYMEYLKRKQQKQEKSMLDFQDYIALTIAMLQTILVPILVIMGLLLVLTIIISYIGSGGSTSYHLISVSRHITASVRLVL